MKMGEDPKYIGKLAQLYSFGVYFLRLLIEQTTRTDFNCIHRGYCVLYAFHI